MNAHEARRSSAPRAKLTNIPGSRINDGVTSITTQPATWRALRRAASRWRRRTPECHASLSYSNATSGGPGYARSTYRSPREVTTLSWRSGSGKPASVNTRATRSSQPVSVAPRSCRASSSWIAADPPWPRPDRADARHRSWPTENRRRRSASSIASSSVRASTTPAMSSTVRNGDVVGIGPDPGSIGVNQVRRGMDDEEVAASQSRFRHDNPDLGRDRDPVKPPKRSASSMRYQPIRRRPQSSGHRALAKRLRMGHHAVDGRRGDHPTTTRHPTVDHPTGQPRLESLATADHTELVPSNLFIWT